MNITIPINQLDFRNRVIIYQSFSSDFTNKFGPPFAPIAREKKSKIVFK